MSLDAMLTYLDDVSVFGRSAWALALLLGVSVGLTLWHTLTEWLGKGGPLWRNFGAIVGLWIPNKVGWFAFFFVLTLLLGTASVLAITGIMPEYAIFALGAMIGARVADTLVSHVLLYVKRYRPNPGLNSTPFYLAEAAFLFFAFHEGLSASPTDAAWGVVLGAGIFLLVLPSLHVLGRLVPAWRRDERWEPPQTLDAWIAANRHEKPDPEHRSA